MKSIILIIFAIFCVENADAADKTKNTTIANEGDFVVVSDVEESSFTIFLSYTGNHFDHCGITLHSHGFVTTPVKISDKLSISRYRDTKDVSEVEGRKVIAKVEDPSISTFGEFFTIETKSGKSIKEELAALSDHSIVEVIVQNLKCAQ